MQITRPMIMGILNITPDSFADGGQYLALDAAIKHAQSMIKQGADIIDIGGESTRPNAQSVSVADELKRVIPAIKAIRKICNIPISIDTSKPQVMQNAVRAGANLINDVNALQADGAKEMAALLGVDVCLMHRQGTAKTMQNNPTYTDVVNDIKDFFAVQIKGCIAAGITADKITIDPGFGFGKTLAHNLEILKRLDEFKSFDLPLLVGLSRKSMIGDLLNHKNIDQRITGSVTAAIIAIQKGADIVRVHNVAQTQDALMILQELN